jgi:hypothetical protein
MRLVDFAINILRDKIHTVSNIPQSKKGLNTGRFRRHFFELAYAFFDPFLTLCSIFHRLPFALSDLMLIWKYFKLSLWLALLA